MTRLTRRGLLLGGAALLAGCGPSARPAPTDRALLGRLEAARREAACCWEEGRQRALAVAVEILPQLRDPGARRRVAALVAEDAARIAELRLENGQHALVDAFGGIAR